MPAPRHALRLALVALTLAGCSAPTAPAAADASTGPRVNASVSGGTVPDSTVRRVGGGGMPWH